MKINEIIGLDMSKLTFDARVHKSQAFSEFKNNLNGYKKLINWAKINSDFSLSETFFVLENTGLYSKLIVEYFAAQKINFCVVPGLEIKRSLGITRGGTDKIDAKRIAKYGYRLRDELECTQLDSLLINQLKSNMNLRNKLVKNRASFKSRLKEQKRVLNEPDYKILMKTQESIIKHFSKQIKKIDQEIEKLISKDKQAKEIYDLLYSIKGIGKVTAVAMIVYTGCFTKFKTWRKFASFAGIAPFPNQSGTSVRKKTKVSNLGNKHIKTLLQMCARSAIQYNKELKQYYLRRQALGKNNMSTMNIIRNKLVARAFAVVSRKTKYVDLMLHKC